MEQSQRFFQNRDCPYFPCHRGLPKERFNCLFCYCPLYALGRFCGGTPGVSAKGRKDCSGCVLPHIPENYDLVLARYHDIEAVIHLVEREGLPHET